MKNLDKPIILSLILMVTALHIFDVNKVTTEIKSYKQPKNRYFIIKTEQREGWWEALETSAEPYDIIRPDIITIREIQKIPKNQGRGQNNKGQGSQGKGRGQQHGKGKGLNK